MIESSSCMIKWPEPLIAQIPILIDRPPYNNQDLLDHITSSWLKPITNSLRENNPNKEEDLKFIIQGLFHVARITQTYFDNVNHGNYCNPFIETLFVLLTWRSRISDAQIVIQELVRSFSSPLDMTRKENRSKLQDIVGKIGFTGKRPDMIIHLVVSYLKKFPEGNFHDLAHLEDHEIIEYLTTINGIGKKTALCVLMYSLGRNRFPIDTHIRRVLRRTQLLGFLYEEIKPKEHRIYQDEVEALIPPIIRPQLHTGLLSIGQIYCTAQSPNCKQCPINKLCKHNRDTEIARADKKKYSHIDLFCGAGGFSTGYNEAGLKTVLAIDNYPEAIRTYQFNHTGIRPQAVIETDLENTSLEEISRIGQIEFSKPENVYIITAGIPCQGFSKAGYRSRPDEEYEVLQDPRNHLYKVIVKWAESINPSYIVIENVPGIRSAGKNEENILSLIKTSFERLGYKVNYCIVNAEDFGVTQTRLRFILIASRSDVREAKVSNLSNYYQNRKKLVDIIGDLPKLNSDDGKWYTTFNHNIIIGHRSRYNNPEDLAIYEALLPGERYKDFVKRRPDIILGRTTEAKRAVYSLKSFIDKYKKLVDNEPSRTIVAHLQRDGNGYIHPDQVRSLTPREAARIQGFNDDFIFTGNQGAQFIQIGNAVPPPIAKAVGLMISDLLDHPEAR